MYFVSYVQEKMSFWTLQAQEIYYIKFSDVLIEQPILRNCVKNLQ